MKGAPCLFPSPNRIALIDKNMKAMPKLIIETRKVRIWDALLCVGGLSVQAAHVPGCEARSRGLVGCVVISVICSEDFYKIGRRVSNAQLRAEREKEAKLKEEAAKQAKLKEAKKKAAKKEGKKGEEKAAKEEKKAVKKGEEKSAKKTVTKEEKKVEEKATKKTAKKTEEKTVKDEKK